MTTLLSVPTLFDRPAPTPAEFRKVVFSIHAKEPERLDRLHADPGLLALHDQHLAAEAENSARLEQAVRRLEGFELRHATAGSLRATAGAVACWIAMGRLVDTRCPHVPWAPKVTSPRTVVHLSARAAVCDRQDCKLAMIARFRDDGRCELCEQKTTRFSECSIPFGACVVYLSLCDECTSFLRDPGGWEETR